jgi:hypothetical protein
VFKVKHPSDNKNKCLHLCTENIHQFPLDKEIKPHINSAHVAVKRNINTVRKKCIFNHPPSAYECTCIYNFRNYHHELMVLFWVVKDLYNKYHSYTITPVLLCRFHNLRFDVLTAAIMKCVLIHKFPLTNFHIPYKLNIHTLNYYYPYNIIIIANYFVSLPLF